MRSLGTAERRELEAKVDAASREAADEGLPRIAWIVREEEPLDPLHVFAAASDAERFFFEDPSGSAFVALGAEETLDGVGEDRLGSISRQVRQSIPSRQVRQSIPSRQLRQGIPSRQLRRSASPRPERPGCDAPAPAGLPLSGPVFAGGFGFSRELPGAVWAGFPPARFVLPGLLLASAGGRTRLTVCVRVAPGADPAALAARAAAGVDALAAALGRGRAQAPAPAEDPAVFGARADQSHAGYARTVRRALEAIREGRFEKVVVARSCTVSRPGGFAAEGLLAAFRAAHPACFRFARASGRACFLGATPERLLRLDGGRISCSALAGSAPRGRSPAEDERLGRALRESKKEQQEHAVVVRALRAALGPCCTAIKAPEAPQLLRLDGIQHLHTPIEARLREDRPETLLALAARLHPSPAVAGAPRDPALAWLRRHEGLDRGWYAGAVGWMRPGGDGELAVALRTVLLRGDDAVLHAGAGVVEGSTPEGELAETRLKLRAGLSALLEL